MRQKLLVEKKLDGLKIGLIGLENMMSMGVTREDFLVEIQRLKDRVQELQVLVGNESEEFS